MNFKNAEAVRRRLEESFGKPLEARIWQYLLEQKKVDLVLSGEWDLNWLSTEVHKILDAAGLRGSGGALPPTRPSTGSRRAWTTRKNREPAKNRAASSALSRK